MRKLLNTLAADALTLLPPASFHAVAAAPAWPTKPVRLLVAYPPGAPGNIIARLIQPGLQKSLGQPVAVDNRPGAGGNIGIQEVLWSTPDAAARRLRTESQRSSQVAEHVELQLDCPR